MEDTVYVVGHLHPDTDSIVSAIAYAELKQRLGENRVRPARAGELNAETRYVLERFALPSPALLTSAAGQQLILVDHNETGQALPDIQHAKILEVWEHHRVGDLSIPYPIVFHCEPVGATATLIAEQYFAHNLAPSPAMAAAMLAGILSDTLAFVSPTCSEKDRLMAQRLEAICGLEAEAFGKDLLAARGDAASRDARSIVESDLKQFDFSGHKVGIAQVETVNAAPLLKRKGELLQELQRIQVERGLLQAVLLVTDISRKGSHVWAVGEQCEVVAQGLGRTFTEDDTFVEGLMSRKKQVVPVLEEAFSRLARPSAPAVEHQRAE